MAGIEPASGAGPAPEDPFIAIAELCLSHPKLATQIRDGHPLEFRVLLGEQATTPPDPREQEDAAKDPLLVFAELCLSHPDLMMRIRDGDPPEFSVFLPGGAFITTDPRELERAITAALGKERR